MFDLARNTGQYRVCPPDAYLGAGKRCSANLFLIVSWGGDEYKQIPED